MTAVLDSVPPRCGGFALAHFGDPSTWLRQVFAPSVVEFRTSTLRLVLPRACPEFIEGWSPIRNSRVEETGMVYLRTATRLAPALRLHSG